MARYLITGMAGFIGSSLAHTLVEQGHEVSGIDNLSTGSLENLADIRHKISFQQADLCDLAAMKSACAGFTSAANDAANFALRVDRNDPARCCAAARHCRHRERRGISCARGRRSVDQLPMPLTARGQYARVGS